MANFYYEPGVQDRRGELLGAGIAAAGENLAAGIQNAVQKHKENKAYAQLAETLGLDPKHSTKLDVQVAMLKNEITTARQAQQQKQKAQAAQARFFQTRASLMKPKPQLTMPARGDLYSTALANPGDMITGETPGMDAGQATAEAFAENPAIFGDDKTAATAVNMAKVLSTLGSSGVTIDAATGLPIIRSGNSIRPINPAWLRPPADPNAFSSVAIPTGGQAFFRGRTQINPRDIIGGPVTTKPGKYPKGARVTKLDNGKVQVTMPDGSFDIVGNAPNDTGDAFEQIEQDAGGVSGSGRGQRDAEPDQTKDNTPAGAEAQEFMKGERVTQGGQMYEFDGTNWNPVNE